MPTSTATKKTPSTTRARATSAPRAAAAPNQVMSHDPIQIGPYWILFYRSNFDVQKASAQGPFVSIGDDVMEWRRFSAMLLQNCYGGLNLNIGGASIATLLNSSGGSVASSRSGAQSSNTARSQPKVTVAGSTVHNGSTG